MDTPASDTTGGAAEPAVGPVTDGDAAQALELLTADEAARGASVVDEAELHRLRRLVAAGERAPGWQPFVAYLFGGVVGYAGVVVDQETGSSVGDAAASLAAPHGGSVLQALLEALGRAATGTDVQVWVRQVGDTEMAAAERAGFAVSRRLGVLGRHLDHVELVTPGGGWNIRAFEPGEDDEAVVAVLAAAYAGTDDGGWDLARLRQRQDYDWFRAEDLLVAQGPDGRLGGLHWLKRRGPGQGEVYNLAVASHAQGSGLGAALLTAGLAHLREAGCLEVILWVDRANERAVRLYEKHGFATRWDDVAFGRAVR